MLHPGVASQSHALTSSDRFVPCAATATCRLHGDCCAHLRHARASGRCSAKVANAERDFVTPTHRLAKSRANFVLSTRAACPDPTAPLPSSIAHRARAPRACSSPERSPFARQTRDFDAPTHWGFLSRVAAFLGFFSDFWRFFFAAFSGPNPNHNPS